VDACDADGIGAGDFAPRRGTRKVDRAALRLFERVKAIRKFFRIVGILARW
jgi:hypothetical protein